MSAKAEDITDFCAQFSESEWREAHFKCDAFEIFVSKDPDAAGLYDPTLDAEIDVSAKTIESQEARVLIAPIFGTLRLRDPNCDDNSIDVGDTISEGDEIASIEVLGKRTPVKAAQSAVIVDILIEDGALVDFGAPLFRLIPVE